MSVPTTRTIAQIQAAIWAAVTADPVLGPLLTSTSQMAIWWLWSWVIATKQWVTESYFTAHQVEVTNIINNQKAGNLAWYSFVAKTFQLGYSLPVDTYLYSPAALPGDPSLIVTFCVTLVVDGVITLRLAKGGIGALVPLAPSELSAFEGFLSIYEYAGDGAVATTAPPDNLQVAVTVYYDPLVLDATGARLDGTATTPVKDGINAYLQSLQNVNNNVYPRFQFDKFIDAIEAIDGVIEPDITVCQANYAATPYVNIITSSPQDYAPNAGYMILDVAYFNTHVTYTPYL